MCLLDKLLKDLKITNFLQPSFNAAMVPANQLTTNQLRRECESRSINVKACKKKDDFVKSLQDNAGEGSKVRNLLGIPKTTENT